MHIYIYFVLPLLKFTVHLCSVLFFFVSSMNKYAFKVKKEEASKDEKKKTNNKKKERKREREKKIRLIRFF